MSVTSARDHFELEGMYGLLICKHCRFAIWPNHLKSHIISQHRWLKRAVMTFIAEVQGWSGLLRNPEELVLPPVLPLPIKGLPVDEHGMQCIVAPDCCSFTSCNVSTIRKHWMKEHHEMIKNRPGRPCSGSSAPIEATIKDATKLVRCQRIFKQGRYSNHIPIADRHEICQTVPNEPLDNSWSIWSMFLERANQKYESIRETTRNLIVPCARNEANPWLRRTGWAVYLDGCLQDDLIASIAEPRLEENEHAVDRVIWDAMRTLGVAIQKTVASSSQLVRIEAVQTDPSHTTYRPLETYQDLSNVESKVRPWQQILMFFLRTQRDHAWKSPEYQLDEKQFQCFQKMILATSNQDETEETSNTLSVLPLLQQRILAFCVELLNQRAKHSEYDLPLVCASAVLGVGNARMAWQTPETYPQIISSIIKIAQMMIIQYATDMAKINDDEGSATDKPFEFRACGSDTYDVVSMPSTLQSITNSVQSLTSSQLSKRRRLDESNLDITSTISLVMCMTRSFMQRGTCSPMQWLLDLRAYGMKIHFNTTAVGHVNWRDSVTLEYKAMSFSMYEFRSMIHSLVKSTKERLFEEVLLTKMNDYASIPAVPWSNIFDDPSNGTFEWSFLNDGRTKLPVDGRAWLLQRMKETGMWEQFVDCTAQDINKNKIADWLRQVAEFRGKLLVLMHMTGGQPARGPEILSLRHKNTRAGAHRNLFIEDGRVVFVTQYHKGYQLSGDVKIIHRYLPQEVGELVVWYLWLVVPFMQRVEIFITGEHTISDHFWPAEVDKGKWTSQRLTKEIKLVTQEYLGQTEGMGIATYRHIAIAIGRKWIKETSALVADMDDFELDAEEEAADQQAGHSSHIAGMLYARHSNEQFGAIADKRHLFKKVSLAWHNFLGFEACGVEEDSASLFDMAATKEYHARLRRLRRMNAEQQFIRMMGEEVKFRSEQEASIQAVLRGDSQILTVMPTGAGKSMLFMLPAWAEPRGMTIVVVPLLALRQDMKSRCTRLQIRCDIWDGRNEPDGATIVLVTPEMALRPEFMTFIRRVQRTKQLDRIVIDECHIILNDSQFFRSKLQLLGRLGNAATQMILMTATLPPSAQADLMSRMCWEKDEVTVFRASTVRPNIAYGVVNADGPTAQDRLRSLKRILNDILKPERQTQERDKVVVMCESIGSVTDIVEARLFDCSGYHSRMSNGHREAVLNDFCNGNIHILVATGAFGMGIDISNVRAVISFDDPRSMLEYAQASGRGGRDGKKTYAIILSGGISTKDERVHGYLQTKTCRRTILDQYIDGCLTRMQCQHGEQACDNCGDQQFFPTLDACSAADQHGTGQSVSTTPSLLPLQLSKRVDKHLATHSNDAGSVEDDYQYADELLQEQERMEIDKQEQQRQGPKFRMMLQAKEKASKREQLRKLLDKWKGRCGMCHFAKLPDYHTINKCARPESYRRRKSANKSKVQLGSSTEMCSTYVIDAELQKIYVTGSMKKVMSVGKIGVNTMAS